MLPVPVLIALHVWTCSSIGGGVNCGDQAVFCGGKLLHL
jgi:hypothetical protein